MTARTTGFGSACGDCRVDGVAPRDVKKDAASDRALEVVDHRAHARERGLALVVDDAALLRELLFSGLELADEHLDRVDGAFLLQAVLGRACAQKSTSEHGVDSRRVAIFDVRASGSSTIGSAQ